MIDLSRYRELFATGDWHVHTSYTDGKSTVAEMCSRAEELGIPLLAFTEHVRRKLDYDFNALLEEIDAARSRHDMVILSGCEAKVLPDGSLDAPDEVLETVDYPIFAFHSFPDDVDLYLGCAEKVIASRKMAAWAHPGLFLRKKGIELPDDGLEAVLGQVKRAGLLMEANSRYALPPASWARRCRELGIPLVRGSDSHSAADLRA